MGKASFCFSWHNVQSFFCSLWNIGRSLTWSWQFHLSKYQSPFFPLGLGGEQKGKFTFTFLSFEFFHPISSPYFRIQNQAEGVGLKRKTSRRKRFGEFENNFLFSFQTSSFLLRI